MFQQCYGFEKIGTNFQPAVQLGCIDTKVYIHGTAKLS